MTLAKRIYSLFGDPVLLFTVVVLSLFGVAMIYSAGQLDVSDPYVTGAWRLQLLWLTVSLVALFVVMNIQVRWLEWVALPAYIFGVLVLAATLVIGTGAGPGADTERWLRLGPISVQPAQFANVATVMMLARTMGGWRETPHSLLTLWKPVAIVAVPMLLVFLQPNLGTALVFGGMLIAALYWAGTPLALMFLLLSPLIGLLLAFWSWLFSAYMIFLIIFLFVYRTYLLESVLILAANLAAGTVALPAWNSLEPYQKSRIVAFINPYADPRGAGYHHIQSQVAIGSGGFSGQGFLQGSQKRLAFLPEQHTDFIYAVIGEELGFVGATLVLLTYLLVLWRLVRLAERLQDPFAGIVVFGIFGVWFTHILINVGMTVGVMPITGLPLPFLSYGGSFLLATYVALGIAQRVGVEHGRI